MTWPLLTPNCGAAPDDCKRATLASAANRVHTKATAAKPENREYHAGLALLISFPPNPNVRRYLAARAVCLARFWTACLRVWFQRIGVLAEHAERNDRGQRAVTPKRDSSTARSDPEIDKINLREE